MRRFLPAILSAIPLFAQSAEQRGWKVLEAALKSAGGREKLAAVRDMSFDLQSRLSTAAGEVSVSSKNQLIFPDTVRQDMSMPVGTLTIAFNSREGWQKGPQGVQKIPPDHLRRTLAHLARVNILFRPPAGPSGVRWVAAEPVEGHACDVIEITSLGDPLRLWVDRGNGEVLKRAYRVENSLGGMANVEEFLSDYRDVDGLHLSFKVRELRDGKFARESATGTMRLNTSLKAGDVLQGLGPGH